MSKELHFINGEMKIDDKEIETIASLMFMPANSDYEINNAFLNSLPPDTPYKSKWYKMKFAASIIIALNKQGVYLTKKTKKCPL